MRVLAVVNVPPHLEVSGAANAARSLSVALAEFCDVDLVQPAFEPGFTRVDGITIRSVVASNPLSFTEPFLPNRVRTPFYRTDIGDLVADYDLVHLHNPIPALELRAIARSCVEHGVPFVVTTHGIVEVAAGGSAYGLGKFGEIAWRKLVAEPFQEVARMASSMYALSPADVEILLQMGVQQERVTIVPNGVDVPPLLEDDALAAFAMRTGLPWPKPDGPVVLFMGNHTRNKGLPVLLEALAEMSTPFLLVAAGSKRDHIDYEAAAGATGAGQEMRFPGFVSDDDVVPMFQYADVLAFPTLADTFPLVVLEAMANETAVVATEVGGIPYQVPEQAGVLVAPNDAHALRTALEELASDAMRLDSMGRAGRAHVETSFTWRAAAELAVNGYRDLLPSPAG